MPPKVVRALDLGTVAGSVGLAVLAGLSLPQQYGLWAPVFAVCLMAVLADRHGRSVSACAAARLSHSLSSQPWPRRLALGLSVGWPTVVITAVAARAVSSIVVAYPAAIWGVVTAGCCGLALAALPVRGGRWLVAAGFALAVPAAGLVGQGWETAGPQARGWATSGQLLGIHPFQATAVAVDGYGPHDIPVNDFVEPDGSRGYGADEVAAALQHSIRAIGRLHYARGPAVAREAFENVRVVAMSTTPLRESLDREPVPTQSTRLAFFSGTTGQRSRIEFVCPGQRQDPRGMPRDTVTKAMCPSKYISEASAGLSVTGRWTGYTEARGQERFGLARQWLGGTRTDDARGAAVVEREVRWGAWLLVAGLSLAAVARRKRGAAQEGLAAVAGAVGLFALLLAAWAVARHGSLPAIGWVETPPRWSTWDIAAWTPAMAIGAAVAATSGLGPEAGQGRQGRTALAVRLAAVPLALGVFASAGALGAAQWLRPDLSTTADGLAFQRWVAGVADALWETGFGAADWSVQQMEAMVASCVAVVLSGAALAMLCSLGASAELPRGAPGGRWARAATVLVASGLVALVVVSRKTAGASALLPAAMGILVIHGSCMGLTSVAGRGRPVALAVHVALVVAGIWLSVASVADLPSHWFVSVCGGLGVAASLGALAFVLPASHPTDGPSRRPTGAA